MIVNLLILLAVIFIFCTVVIAGILLWCWIFDIHMSDTMATITMSIGLIGILVLILWFIGAAIFLISKISWRV